MNMTANTQNQVAIELVQKEIADLNQKIINDELQRKSSKDMSLIDKRILKQKEQQLALLTGLSKTNNNNDILL